MTSVEAGAPPTSVPEDNQIEDQELLLQARAGDSAAAAELITRHADAIGAGVRQVVMHNSGYIAYEDLEQDVRTRACQAIASGKLDFGGRTASGWFRVCGMRVGLDVIKSSDQRCRSRVPAHEVLANRPAATEDIAQLVVARTLLAEVLSFLSDRERLAFQLKAEGWSGKECAEELGFADEYTFKAWLYRVRTKVKEQFGENLLQER